jgi:hypothetical protein
MVWRQVDRDVHPADHADRRNSGRSTPTFRQTKEGTRPRNSCAKSAQHPIINVSWELREKRNR